MSFFSTIRHRKQSRLVTGIQIFLLVLIVIGLWMLLQQDKWLPGVTTQLLDEEDVKQPSQILIPESDFMPSEFDGRNITLTIEGVSVKLVDGVSIVPTGPGSATVVKTKYSGNDTSGDLTGDGQPDVAFLVTQDRGGSGTFYYAVVAVKDGDSFRLTNAFLIGDRIAPQLTIISPETRELRVNYRERRPEDPMTAAPYVETSMFFKVTPEGVLERLVR